MEPARPGYQRIRIDDLQEFCVSAMLKTGMRDEDARVTARVLVTTDSWGVFTHGTKNLRLYLGRIRAGGIDAKAVPQVVSEGPAWAMIDARRAMAMVSSYRAMELAIEKAGACGIGYVGVKQSTHFGAAGFYACLAAEQGMIGLAMSNVDVNMNAPGARGGVIGNNPFAYAVPAAEGHPILLDVALSAVAAGKVGAALERGEPIPDTWLVDENGVPTTDAAAYPNRATLLPMGGHKGYGLAVMVEVLAAVLTGASITRDVKSWVLEPDKVTDEGHAFIAIDIGAMMPRHLFQERVEAMARGIRDSPKAKGAARIYLPGEKEWESREEAMRNGIRLPTDVVASLDRMGEESGIGRPPYLGNDA
jgi:LDH2 family malate/lactate/ureidoglycolate dehydrogenase